MTDIQVTDEDRKIASQFVYGRSHPAYIILGMSDGVPIVQAFAAHAKSAAEAERARIIALLNAGESKTDPERSILRLFADTLTEAQAYVDSAACGK